MKKTTKLSAVSLLVVFAASMFTGCDSFGGGKKSNDAIIEACEAVCEAVKSNNYKKFTKLISEDEAEEDALEELEVYCEDHGEFSEFVEAVLDGIEYEIDEKSISEKKDTTSVTVEFTYIDVDEFNKGGPYDDEDDILDAIEDCDTTSEEYTFQFINDDDEWLLVNVEEVNEIYSVLNDIEIDISGSSTVEVDPTGNTGEVQVGDITCEWFFVDDDGNYVNAQYIDCDLMYSGNDVTWECSYNGSVVASGMGTDAWVFAYACEGISLVNGDYLPEGDYTITFYENNKKIFEATTPVYVDESLKEETDLGEGNPWDNYGYEYSFNSEELQKMADELSAEGWLIIQEDENALEGTKASEGFMATGPDLVSFMLVYESDTPDEVFDSLLGDIAGSPNVQTADGVTTIDVDGFTYYVTINGNIVILSSSMP